MFLIAYTTMFASKVNFRYIYLLFGLLLSWNPYKELQTWLVVLESIHQELVESTTKHDSTKR